MAKEKHLDTATFTTPSGVECVIQELTAEAERGLADREALRTGRAIDRLMRHAIVSWDGAPLPENDGAAMELLSGLRVGDRNYILLQIRILTYGAEMVFNSKCPSCGKTAGYRVDLAEMLADGELKVWPYRDDVPLIVETRDGPAEVGYLTGKGERWLASLKEIDPVSLAVAACWKFNGEPPTVGALLKLSAGDLSKIRLAFMGLKGGLDPNIELDCPKCGGSYGVTIHSIPDFFMPLTSAETIGR